MAKLTTLSAGLSTIGSALQPATNNPTEREQSRSMLEPWRAWYHTKAWSRLRRKVLTRDLFTCQQPGCGFCSPKTSLLVAHHKIRHRGLAVLFWDENNLVTVCKTCHDGPIKAAERAAFVNQGGA